MIIRTRYYSTPSGAGRIRATAIGKQRTTPYDHASSDPHRVAAEAFCEAIGMLRPLVEVDRDARGAFPNARYWTVQ